MLCSRTQTALLADIAQFGYALRIHGRRYETRCTAFRIWREVVDVLRGAHRLIFVEHEALSAVLKKKPLVLDDGMC